MPKQQAAEQMPRVSRMLGRKRVVHRVSPTLVTMSLNLRAAMVKADMTLNQLAVRSGLPVPTVENYLHSRSFPGTANLAAMAEALGTEVRKLVVKK